MYKVGDKLRVTGRVPYNFYKNGEIVTVKGITNDGALHYHFEESFGPTGPYSEEEVRRNMRPLASKTVVILEY